MVFTLFLFSSKIIISGVIDYNLAACPQTLKRLEVSQTFEQPIDFLPSTLTHLTLGNAFNLPIFSLPPNLTSLIFSLYSRFNQPISCLPLSLHHLEFGHRFNSSPFPLPDGLQFLSFGLGFEQKLEYLPSNLKKFNFFNLINLPKLPPKLEELSFVWYSEPLPLLPSSLTYLNTGLNYNNEVHAAHTSLKCIYSRSLHLNLPPSLTTANIRCLDKFDHLTNLTIIQLYAATITSTATWPANVKHINLHNCNFEEKTPLWPSTLLTLSIFCGNNISLDHLPPTLTKLVIDRQFNQSIDSLPPLLQTLIFEFDFNQPVDHLPSSLTQLNLGNAFNQTINNLPQSLTILNLGEKFDQPIDHLPQSLTSLTISGVFNQSINHLPSSLKILEIESNNFKQDRGCLPSSITTLSLPGQVLPDNANIK